MKDDIAKRRVRAQYDALAARYERRWSHYVDASTEATLQRVRLEPGVRVLDVGCGTGLLLIRLLERQPSAWPAGVDLSPGMVAQARARVPSGVPILVGDAERLPFPATSFDVVVSTSSFHYWPSPAGGLAELRRVLRPGGQVVITDWCDDYFACRVSDRLLRLVDPAHRRIYGQAECGALLRRARYDAVRVEQYRINWLWGLMSAMARAPAV
jgi:ubiquinone/menaquinone biosynthesis C-methylase UbiE